jgi:hypothetical protein
LWGRLEAKARAGEERAGERGKGSGRALRLRSGQALAQGAGGNRQNRVDLSGRWEVEITVQAGLGRHVLTLDKVGDGLTGRHQTRHLENEVTGSVQGGQMTVVAEHPYEGTRLVYTFRGEVDGDEVRGEVEIGTEGQSAPGPLNRMEYGRFTWTGRRRG